MKIKELFNRQRGEPRKLALLIGINYDQPEEPTEVEVQKLYGKLRNPRKDIDILRNFLINCCQYDKDNIITMLDGPNDSDVALKPTENNIRRQIIAWIKKVKPSDRLLFAFAGHSDQEPNKTGSEDDGQDEKIMALNGGLLDNELYKLLVEPLPAKAHLIAIFDSCHSGTMLDLKHYDCNRLYFPWISKGFRNTKTSRCMVLTRRNAAWTYDVPSLPHRAATLENENSLARTQTYSSLVHLAMVARSKTETELEPRGRALRCRLNVTGKRAQVPSAEVSETFKQALEKTARVRVLSTSHANETLVKWTAAPLTEEPETSVKQCWGFCPQADPLDEQASTVISLAACNDGQQAWDIKLRGSLIPMLVNILREETSEPFTYRELTYRELMGELSCKMHANTLELHKKSKEIHLEACRLARENGQKHQDHCPTEQINFQDIMLGSEIKLNLDDKFLL